jgi:outer membrane receptor protein involved in Fe transport
MIYGNGKARGARSRLERFRLVLLAAGAGLALPLGSAHAQERGAAEASAPTDEIIVSARKRQESAIAVPVVETVLTAETIERAAITDLKDVAKFAPGLTVGQNVLSVGAQISIRGYGTSASDPGVDQSVSLNIDGMTFTQGLSFESGFFDLAQIEVLKGPQSLFFGKSSPGGVISLRTADPGSEAEIIARGGYEFASREYRGEVIFSTPVANGFGVRFAGMAWNRDGFFKNTATALPGTGALDTRDRIGGGHGNQFRATVLFEPSPAFDLRLKANYVYDFDRHPAILQLVACPEGLASSPGNPFPPTINPTDDCTLNRTVSYVDLSRAGFPTMASAGGPRLAEKTQLFGTLEMNFRPASGLTLTSVTGFYDLDADNLSANGSFTSYSGAPFGLDNRYDRQEFTQELRATSDFSGPINFTLGAFYQDADVSLRADTYANQAILPFLPPQLAAATNQLDIKSLSGFGQLRYNPVETLEIAVGGRYTDEKRKFRVFDPRTGLGTPVAVPKISSGKFAPEATVTYRPTDDLTFFASFKKAYKSGSYVLGRLDAAPGQLPDNSFGDEKIEGGEGGIKSRLFDRQLSLNIAGYYYDVKGLQVGTVEANDAANGLPIQRTINAGAGRLYGIDLDASYRPRGIDGLNLYASVNWNRTKFTDFDNVPCFGGQTVALGCNRILNPTTGLYTAQSVTGKPFVRAPEWQVNFGAVYDMPIADDWTLTLASENFYSSKYYRALGLRDAFIQDSFLKVGGSITLKSPDDQWELAVIGKNLTNQYSSGFCGSTDFTNNFFGQQQITGGAASGPDGIDELMCSADTGRTVWLRLTFRPFN